MGRMKAQVESIPVERPYDYTTMFIFMRRAMEVMAPFIIGEESIHKTNKKFIRKYKIIMELLTRLSDVYCEDDKQYLELLTTLFKKQILHYWG